MCRAHEKRRMLAVVVAALVGVLTSCLTVDTPSLPPMRVGTPVRVPIEASGAEGAPVWSANGQLGNSSTPTWDPPSPVAVEGLGGIVTVAAGISHSCASLVDGSVSCWGSEEHWELGVPGSGDRYEPAAVPGVTEATSVKAGAGHSCALRGSGGVTCWGANGSGQLGTGSTSYRSLPAPVPGLTSITQISLGVSHSCALAADGVVSCWGANEDGRLGDGTTVDRSSPVTVLGL